MTAKSRERLTTCLDLGGMVAVSVGFGLLQVAAGLIMGGACALLTSYRLTRPRRRAQ